MWESALPELTKELTVKCAQSPQSLSLLDIALTRKEVIVLASAGMARGGDELIIGVYRYGLSGPTSTGSLVFSHSILLDIGRSSTQSAPRNLRLAVAESDDLVLYVFGQKLVYMVQGDAKGHETPSYLSLEAQNTFGGGVALSVTSSATASSGAASHGSPSSAAVAAAPIGTPQLLLLTDSGGVMAVHFKSHSAETDDSTVLPDVGQLSVSGAAPPPLVSSDSQFDSKHSATPAAPRTSDSKAGAARSVPSTPSGVTAPTSYLTDSKQSETNIELLRTALHLFVHNQTAEAIAALRTFEQKVLSSGSGSGGSGGSGGQTNALSSASSSTLDECVLAVSTRVIDAVPFTGRARLENAVASTGLPLHDGMRSLFVFVSR